MDPQLDVNTSQKNTDDNATDTTTSENLDDGSGASTAPTDDSKAQQQLKFSDDVAGESFTPLSEKLCPGESQLEKHVKRDESGVYEESPIISKSTKSGEIYDCTEITEKLTEKDLSVEDSPSTSNKTELLVEAMPDDKEKNQVKVESPTDNLQLTSFDIENKLKLEQDMPGYKETLLDDVSDSDLELRWTDDEDSQMQLDVEPLNDEALKKLDKELSLSEPSDNTEKNNTNVVNRFNEVTSNINEKKTEVIRLINEDSTVDETVNPYKKQLLDDDEMLKKLDQELGIADDDKQIDISIDKTIDGKTDEAYGDTRKVDESLDKSDDDKGLDQTVDELQQLIDSNDTGELKSKNVDKETTPMEESPIIVKQGVNTINKKEEIEEQIQSETIRFNENDKIDCMDISESSKVQTNAVRITLSTIDIRECDKGQIQPMNIDVPSRIGENTKTHETPSEIDSKEISDAETNRNFSNLPTLLTKNVDVNVLPKDCDGSIDVSKQNYVDKVHDVSSKTGDDYIENDEHLTVKVENDSSTQINTEHKINRPDVMLHIPTQEIEFDDFDDTSDKINISALSNTMDADCSNMIEKTVTEIVNQLTKEEEEKNILERDDMAKNPDTYLNQTANSGIEKTPSSTVIESTMENFEEIVNEIKNTVLDKEISKLDCEIMTSNLSPKTDHRDLEEQKQNKQATENLGDIENINIDHKTVEKVNKICAENVINQPGAEGNRQDLQGDLKPIQVALSNNQEHRNESTDEKSLCELEKVTEKSSESVNDAKDSNTEALKKDLKATESSVESEDAITKTLEEKDSKSSEISTCEVDGENDHKKDSTITEESAKELEKCIQDKIDVQPSTSTAVAKIMESEDNSEDAQVVADSLGLLAESSRVLDDDDDQEVEDDGEDGDADEGDGDDDDDDDFDPDDEESSNQHSEESNPPISEIDIKDERINIVFGNEADSLNMADSNDANDGFAADEMENSTDITIEEEQLQPTVADNKEADNDAKQNESDQDKNASMETRNSILIDLLSRTDAEKLKTTKGKESADKSQSLGKTQSKNEDNIVELVESSSEDDNQVKESKEKAPSSDTKLDKDSDILPKSDKEMSPEESADASMKKDDKSKGEIFNLDSDEDEKMDGSKDIEETSKPRNTQCINHNCTSDTTVPYYLADRVTIAYYGAARRRKRAVCQSCLDIVTSRNHGLLTGIKDLRPLMMLRMSRPTQQLLEISDSDSEGEDEPVGEGAAKILEEQLAELLNDTWMKYKMDDRLKETEDYVQLELEKMDKKSKEIDELLNACQKATDKLRVEFYAGFEPNRTELPALSMHDTPIASYACLETDEESEVASSPQMSSRYPKRRSSSTIDMPAKKQALPNYMDDKNDSKGPSTLGLKDEDKDISLVRLSAESAPAELPPPGELKRPILKAGAAVYAMKNPYGAWLRAKLLEVVPKAPDQQFTQCRVRFEHKTKNLIGKVLAGRCIAYTEPCDVRMTIGTRVIALFKNADNMTKRQSFFYSGIIAEIPNPVNSYRYLVFFDDGYVQYVQHGDVRLVYESSELVWEEVHPFSREFVTNYLLKYPERPMVRMHTNQTLVVEYNGKWLETKVIAVDAALVKVQFGDNRTEWIYRGSTRLQPLFVEFQAAKRGDRARLPRSTKQNTKTDMPYVEYTRSDEQAKNNESQQAQAQIEELRRQRAVAKKSTTAMPPVTNPTSDFISRVVFYTPKNSVRPYKMVPHVCGPQCKRTDVLSLAELRTYNPLTKPLLSGWERQIVRHKYSRVVMYRAPCGRRLRCMRDLHRYLRAVRSDMPVDLFDFNVNTHCLAEFVLNVTNVQKKDLSHGKENVPVPCVNYYDSSLPEFCSYNTERTPTAGVPLNLDPEFLCGCDCDDDCADKTKCACWKMTLEGARTIGIEGPDIGYEYRRLPEPLPSGIYECNSRCKCKHTCLNRVVQNPLQLKLQVFKTVNRGWGIRALNDVPKGSFLCIYAGNLLTDATANLDGLNEGDEYLAELDYIEVVEAMKEGYEDDIPEADKKLDKKESKKLDSEPESESSESEEDDKPTRTERDDDDFHPAPHFGMALTEFNKRLRRRDKTKKNKEGKETKEDKEKEQNQDKEQAKAEDDDDCITISDDEEVRVSTREPARFTAQEAMTDKVIPKYRSIRHYYGKDEACYIMDAKVQGNIGRYLNHSCSPNVFVQNVFVDTHDPRFPWVSFFALHHIRAGTELTWNYNYDIGSVPGKVLYCFCGAPNCRGRLL